MLVLGRVDIIKYHQIDSTKVHAMATFFQGFLEFTDTSDIWDTKNPPQTKSSRDSFQM